VPRREEVAGSIARAFSTLKKLRTATNTAKAPYDVLRRLIKKLPSSSGMQAADVYKKRRYDTPPSGQGSMPVAAPMSEPSVDESLIAPAPIPVPPSQLSHVQAQYEPYADPAPAAPGRIQTGGQSYVSYSHNGTDPTYQHYTYTAPPNMPSIPATAQSTWPVEMTNVSHMQNLTGVPPQINMGFQQISDAELGDLAMLWNWESLDLGYTSNPIYQEM
ncbi:unnamed protein product, partial [Fusarium langsethiae]